MLELKNVFADIGDFQLRNISLKIGKGDYYILLGPSGSGKSVLLELISGFYKLKSGNIFLNNTDISHFKIQDRKIGFLYQDFAVFPHLTVEENLKFPLKYKNLQKSEIEFKVLEIAKQLEIENLLKRKPTNLSGGELQRIALARTLITKPEILLLDEPLSSLDIQLHKNILILLKKLNKNGQTIIHVTHNYSEALALANKVAIISEGKIIQNGTLDEVFYNPDNKFIANFVGISNYFEGEIVEINNKLSLKIENSFEVEVTYLKNLKAGKCNVIINEEKIQILKENQIEQNSVKGIIVEILKIPENYELIVNIGFYIFIKISNDDFNENLYQIGKMIYLVIKEENVKICRNQ